MPRHRYTKSAIARACDDFYPADPASHTAHIGNAAYNALFLGALVQPDWDMFQVSLPAMGAQTVVLQRFRGVACSVAWVKSSTARVQEAEGLNAISALDAVLPAFRQSKHPAAELHGVARAVCGGAVYVSDKPGEHDFSLLQRLVLPDGAVLRARLPGRPTRDSLFKDPMRDGHSLLKVILPCSALAACPARLPSLHFAAQCQVWNRNAFGGVVGVFNIQGASWDRSRRRFHVHDSTSPWLSTGVSPNDVWDLRTADSCKEVIEPVFLWKLPWLNGLAALQCQQFLMWYSIAQKFQLVAGEGGHVMVKVWCFTAPTVSSWLFPWVSPSPNP